MGRQRRGEVVVVVVVVAAAVEGHADEVAGLNAY